jgi:3-deoxy-manno-octulosonate cytidylyltransferase (CMP-KDO synthetase)
MPSIVAVIPARYGSSRFPAKMLAPLKGKPLIQWVWEGVKTSRLITRLIVATDDDRIAAAARGFGAEVAMTDAGHPSGTDRIAEATRGIEADWILNVQGDEPLVRAEILDPFLSALKPEDQMATLARKIDTPGPVRDPNVVKVVSDLSGNALYFSRSPIPCDRDGSSGTDYWQHLGIYAYRPGILRRIVALPPSPLEQVEKLEQLRALQNGIAIRVLPTSLRSIGVDTPEDLERVAHLL